MIVSSLSLSEKNILSIKKERLFEAKSRIPKVIKCLKIKFISYFVFIFICLLFFWFFLSCFGAVYVNTQMTLLTDTIISFGLSLLVPLGTNLLPGIFRLIAIKSEKQDQKFIYNFSKIIQLLL